MWEKNLNQRLLIIGAAIVIALILLYPPSKKLRPGLDIAGGVSLLYEIDDTGMTDRQTLAEDMKTLLQRRVDPQGVYNLVWRVHGRNRLEIQMPLPPKGATAARDRFAKAFDDLFKTIDLNQPAGGAWNIKRSVLEEALRLPPDARQAALQKLAVGSAQRTQLLQEAAKRHDQYLAAQEAARQGPGTTQPASNPATPETNPASAPAVTQEDLDLRMRNAAEEFQDAVDAVLATNLDPRRFQEVLDMEKDSKARQIGLDQILKDQAPLKDKIQQVVALHEEWRQNRGFLDGPADLQRLLKGAGVLEFRILAEPSPENATKYDRYRQQLQERGPRPREGDTEGWFRIDNPVQFFNLDSPAKLAQFDPKKHSGPMVADKYGNDYYVLSKLGPRDGLLGTSEKKWRLKWAGANRNQQGQLVVSFQLDVVGGDLFHDLTKRNVNKQLCIFVDNVAYSAANIHEAIRSTGQISGDFSPDKVSYLVRTMQAGALPARLKDTPLSERTIGSSLGESNLQSALRAGVISAIAVAAVMLIYYMWCGLIANVAMAMNVLFVLAVMAMLNARFTLDGIAGLILTAGMAVDSNVLIYERMREEKERGASLRMIIKNGYDKAFATIFDSHVTTLLTSIILYYVGSEEVKGFGLTLGWGIVLNLFSSVFATRVIFTLLVKYNWIKDIKMRKVIGVPNFDWYGRRKLFFGISLTVTVVGMALMAMHGRNSLDIEFLGGVNAEIELKKAGLNDLDIKKKLEQIGAGISEDGKKLSSATVEPVAGDAHAFRVRLPGVHSVRIAALLTEPLEEAKMLERGGVNDKAGENEIIVRLKDHPGSSGKEEPFTLEELRNKIQGLARTEQLAGENIARAVVGSITELGDTAHQGLLWQITTTETNKLLVQYALAAALGDQLRVQPRINYVLRDDPNGRPFPITDKRLENVIKTLPPGMGADVADYRGGAAIFFDQLNPPQNPEVLTSRLRNMRLQPGYESYPWRDFSVIGIQPAGKDTEGNEVYSSVVVAVADPAHAYSDNPEQWATELALKEQKLVEDTFKSEQALRKVTQFKPQIAAQATQEAIVALVLSWAMIIAYVWVRFGRLSYGIGGVIALVHDVLVALSFVGFSSMLAGFLLIEDFKINMTIVAALLTIIGFSISDTIVIFDRIREVRGRLGVVTPEVINRSINETLSRTIMTSFTVFLVMLLTYIFGGSGIRGFCYCMLIGVLTGTYSSVAIAAPLLLWKRFFKDTPMAENTAAPVPATAKA